MVILAVEINQKPIDVRPACPEWLAPAKESRHCTGLQHQSSDRRNTDKKPLPQTLGTGSIPVLTFPLTHVRSSTMAQATARHILVDSEAKCEELKKAIEGGQDFAEVAKQHSSCPSGRNGGDLGSFGPGQMVPEFDKAVFNSELNTVLGPIKTQFGYHLLEVTSRS
jgi:peptidyl-prolyl cis-trans isomerase C